MEKRDYRTSPLWDCRLSVDQRLDYLMAELTLEEKLRCLGTGCPAIERLGIQPFFVGGEGAHGLQARHDQSFDKGEPQPTTVFPCPVGMSSTWDVDILREMGRVVGNEARAVFARDGGGGLCLWAPTVDMERDPRWGRTEEAYGEDPFLAGKMSAAYVRGLRGDDPFYIRCGATLKHFYANNVEDGRVWKSSSIDDRNRYEYYLEPFRRAVMEGGAEGIMTAYNEVDGVPCLISDEMQRIAKDAWGVKHIVSDGGDMMQTVDYHNYFGSHVETVAAGLKAGLDCFTDDIDVVVECAREAYERGMITVEDIDRALRCHFGTMIRLGLFDALQKNPYASIGAEELNSPANQSLARRMTAESVILLQNRETQGGKLLPIEHGRRLAVIGPWADSWLMDWYSGVPPYHVTPWEGILACLTGEKEGSSLGYAAGICKESGSPQIQLRCGGRYLGLLEDGETVGLVEAGQAEDFEVVLWDDRQMTLRTRSNGKLLSVQDGRDEQGRYRGGVVTASKDEAFGWFVKEAFQVEWEGDSFYRALQQGASLSICSWNGSELFVDRTGRLRVCEEGGFVEDGELRAASADYERLAGFQAVMTRDSLQAAVDAAASADVVIVLAGAHPMITCKEENDRRDIEFPPYQRELIQAVYAVNPKIVLSLITSVPFAICWEKEHIPAILSMSTGSMELGNGLADVLFGKVSPAGRLCMTWYRDTDQLPDINDYDIIQGERTYQYFQGEILYPFGHGMTYSQLDYSDMQVRLCDRTLLRVSLQIQNTGDRKTDEVVQIYVVKKDSAVKRPIRQLKAFQRVKDILPEQVREVVFDIPLADLQYFDVIEEQMLVEPGEYELQAGASSQDIRLRESIVLSGTPRGMRDAMRRNLAEYYSSSAHAYRWEGCLGYVSLVSEDNAPMVLEYDRVSPPQTPEHLVLYARMAKGAKIEAFWDGTLLGSYTKKETGRVTLLDAGEEAAAGNRRSRLRRGDDFGRVVVPLTEEGKSCCRSSGTLKLVCTGDAAVCWWQFEAAEPSKF